jgi:hypothetical protein
LLVPSAPCKVFSLTDQFLLSTFDSRRQEGAAGPASSDIGPRTRPRTTAVRSARLAAEEDLSDRYDSRLLRLAWLAPEVLKRLVVYREPSTISIYDLCFVASLPWDQQPGRVFD